MKTLIPSPRANVRTANAVQTALNTQLQRSVATIGRDKNGLTVAMLPGQEERRGYVCAFVSGFLAARGL
jgi:hypothetical protein